MGLYRSKNITAAKRTATKYFNRYIRIRDADKNGNVACVTCGEVNHIKSGKVDAAHFVEADIMATRFNEMNVHASCKACNLSANGKQYQHGNAIKLLHGKEIPEELIEESKKEVSFSKEELMEIARKYKRLGEQIAKQKGIQL